MNNIEIPTPTNEWRNAIKEIKIRYAFYDDYDLEQQILSLYKSNIIMGAINQVTPSSSEVKNKLKELITIFTKAVDALASTDDLIHGYANILIAEVIKISANPKYNNRDWSLSTYQIDSQLALLVCHHLLRRLPSKKGGKKPTSTREFIITMLSGIFSNGTGKELECTHNGWNKTYSGEIYMFILDIKPLLRQIGIEVVGGNNCINEQDGIGNDYALGNKLKNVIKKFEAFQRKSLSEKGS